MLLGLAGSARAAPTSPPEHYSFRTFGLEEGLTNLSPLSFAQDTRGLLWVGTEDGLFSYEGQRFTRYGLKEGVPSGTINELAVTPDGVVWVGTELGLARVDDGQVQVVREVPATRIESLSVTKDGGVWVCVQQTTGGLYRRRSDGVFEQARGWPGGACTATVATAAGDLLVATHEGLVAHTADGAWHVEPTRWGADHIDALLLDGQGALWARSSTELLMRPAPEAPFERVDQGLGRAYLSGRLLLGPDGALWVPTVLGLARREHGRWSVLSEAQGLPTTNVSAAFIDAEGSVWLGGAGLHRWLGRGQWAHWSKREGLPSDAIWSVLRDAAGTLWVGTDEGVAAATASGWETLPFTHELGVKTMALASDGSLWLGGTPAIVLHWSPATGQVERFDAAAGVRGNQVTSLVVDPEGAVWVGAEEGGLAVARPGQPPGALRFEPVALPGGSPHETFRSLVLDAQGRLWAGGSEGLAIRDAAGWRRFTTRDGLLMDFAGYLFARDDGAVRLASWGSVGLSVARDDDGKLRCEHDRTLEGRKVYLLGEDRLRHWLFVGTGSGLEVFDGVHWRHLSKSDGLPGDDYDANAFFAEPNGDVWVGTSTGLAVIHTPRLVDVPAPPRVLLERALLGHQALRPRAADAEVEHTERTLDVNFAGLSFTNEAKVNYGTRLVGLDTTWRESAISEVRYTNLAPGTYTFEARARAGDGPWGEPAQLHFRIRPAFWQTRWFEALVVLAVVTVALLAVRWRRAAVRGARALTESEARLRSVFALMGEGVVLRDEQGQPAMWNASAEEILGLSTEQLKGTAPLPEGFGVTREDGTPIGVRELIAGVTRSTGESQRRVVMALHVTGAPTKWVSVSSEPMRTKAGATSHAVVTTLTDVTELRQGREELQAATRRATEASQLKSQFLANMSHEIRTPLNAVLGLSRLSLEESSPEKVQEYVRIIQRSGEGLLGLVNDILDFSKIEAGKLTVERIPFLLRALLHELTQALEPMVESKGLRFSLECAPGVPDAVLGDPLRVRQVLTNLLSNAIKFTPLGSIEVRVSVGAGEQVIFAVRDTGIGMTPPQRERLFEAFSQADSTTTRRFGGTGLGLAISRSLARAMGGDLEVTSQPDQGSTFTFTCPLTPASAEAARALAPATRVEVPASLQGRRVLLVEDNKVNQLLARVLLQKAGLQVTLAEDGRQGVDAVLENPEAFDVVLMDVQMPVMDGYEATAAIRQALGERAPPIIAMTANALLEQKAQSTEAGMVAHLSKPIDVAELYALLARYTAGR
jgi:PAS domain S-box-containing protein